MSYMVITLFRNRPRTLAQALKLENIGWSWPKPEHDHEPAPPAKWCRGLTTEQTMAALKGDQENAFWQAYARWNLGEISGEEFADAQRKRWESNPFGRMLLEQLKSQAASS